MVKIKKLSKVYGRSPIMLIHFKHLVFFKNRRKWPKW